VNSSIPLSHAGNELQEFSENELKVPELKVYQTPFKAGPPNKQLADITAKSFVAPLFVP
jgi:hypothetical protein